MPATIATPLAEPLGCICPECDGSATEIVFYSAARDWETGEPLDAEEIACPACDGLGYLTTPATADEPWWRDVPLDDVPPEDAFTQALKFTITRGLR